MTVKELTERQSWTLDQKIDHSIGALNAFVNKMGGVEHVYVSFSGGKDSTVLLHLARRIYPDILAAFVNTGCEYPDLLQFIKKKIAAGEKIEWIRPKMTPREVWEKFGFPLVSKEQAYFIHSVRNSPDSPTARLRMSDHTYGSISKKWRFLIGEKFDTHSICCSKLKKQPMERFQKESHRYPILGTMASESLLRRTAYIKNGGCNVFDGPKPHSTPLAIWTDDDIWEYIERYGLEVPEIYYKGMKSTGCAGCGFGACYLSDKRFDILYEVYPKMYDMVMNYTNNGVTFREALRKTFNVTGKYLPDEIPDWMKR